ncbi:uncharacterized protein EV420DRAFT_1636338 [Desarmillaria tabescens]|uniref:ATP-dependent DNA ligase family profile domain-containing protein n=1 Tax=Armillaria tabescens TaxID=1929756 RepID=A0AA39TZ80_ARMTA|nr:uncharacterized protein EV420DRAFT_1636338 [Desarmillaria tabescens]KAK0467324.1 hypothetical protein EV420DRAFT_1636338 [Desarmillaria tabescens]
MDSYDSSDDTNDVDDESEHDRIDFSFFTSLLTAIAQVSSNKSAKVPRYKADYPALNKFRLWVDAFRKRYPNPAKGTTAIIFRLLFPEEDVRRKYDMQEKRLAQALGDALATSDPRLLKWDQDGASGCLGAEVRHVMNQTSTIDPEQPSRLTIDEADIEAEEEPHNSRVIFKAVRRRCFFSYADHPERSPSALSKEDAMKIWDPTKSMLQSYSYAATLEDAAAAFENGVTISAPKLGIPKSLKGQGCSHALSLLRSAKVVWVETKYDGERAQIHVEVLPSGIPNITIFSKSKRDSTQDRAAVHSIVVDGLGPDLKRGRIRNAILDAEMVAHNGERIDEFWRIRKLVENTAVGPRARKRPSVISESQSSLLSDDGNEERHLALVFFDVLYLNSVSLLSSPYRERRKILESIIQPIPAYVMLSDRIPILMHNPEEAEAKFRQVYAESIADYQEGVVLKADDGGYNRVGHPWVKLKRDYIQGLGDTVDLVFLGAGWAKDRGRELNVPTDTFTTFYIGTLTNSEELKYNPDARPHFLVHFVAEYGLNRDTLEHINFCIKSSEPVPYSLSRKSEADLPYLFELYKGLHPPSFLLRCPLLVEVMGANFTKSEGSKEYELRFPRILKIYRPAERSWRDGVNRQELRKIARKAVGRDSKHKDIEDDARTIWKLPTSSSVRCLERRKTTIVTYEEKLLERDRKRKGSSCFDSAPTKRMRKSDTIPAVAISSPRSPLRMATNIMHLSSPIPGTPSLQSPESQPTKVPLSSSPQFEVNSESKFLQESLVFFVESPSDSLPFARPWKKLVPHHCRVHALSSLFDGCGWQTAGERRSSPWAKRGIIFVDKGRSATRDWEAYIYENIAKRKLPLPTRKPIWIFDGSSPVSILKRQALHVFS